MALPADTVCVTGATGYIAGHIIQQLLDAGYTVHGTCRDPQSTRAVGHLWKLPGAHERLKLFKADLTVEGSFDEAIQGCTYVLHTASPFFLQVSADKVDELLLRPAIQGTENVFRSINRCDSVKKVVLTASTASVFTDPTERGKGHVFSEADWNITAGPRRFPYFYSKRMAEQRAYDMHKEAGGRWGLCSINPGAVWGPPLSGRLESESVQQILWMLSGRMWPFYANIGAPIVDVRDVARAHIAAMATPQAEGRYLINSRSCWMLKLASRMLRRQYPERWVPPAYMSTYLTAPFCPLVGLPMDLSIAMQFKLPEMDVSKAARDLNMKPETYIPPEQSLQDMLKAFEVFGLMPKFETPRVPAFLMMVAALAGCLSVFVALMVKLV